MTADEFLPLCRIEMLEDKEGFSLRSIACLIDYIVYYKPKLNEKKVTFIWPGQNISFMYDTIGSC